MTNDASIIMDSRGQIDLAAFVRRVWNGRWLVIGASLLVSVAFIAVAFNMEPVYRSQAVLAPAPINHGGMPAGGGSGLGSLGGLAALAGLNIGGGAASATEESLAVLRSREFTENFIADNDLMPKLFSHQWDSKSHKWTTEPGKEPTLAMGFLRFDQSIREVDLDKRTGLATLKIEWRDPAEAAFWANELIARLNREMRARAINTSNAAIGYLEKELTTTSTVETRSAISHLMEAQVNERMLATVTQEYVFRVVDKAMPADPRERVRPKKFLMAVLGAMFGFIIGAAIAAARGTRAPRANNSTTA